MLLYACLWLFPSNFQWSCNFTYSKRITNLYLARALPFSDIHTHTKRIHWEIHGHLHCMPSHAIWWENLIRKDGRRIRKTQNENEYELIEKNMWGVVVADRTLFCRPENSSFLDIIERYVAQYCLIKCASSGIEWMKQCKSRIYSVFNSLSHLSQIRDHVEDF